MAYEIRKTQDAPYYVSKSKPKKNKDYLSFIHTLPCCVTGSRRDIQAAHLSFANPSLGHYGRGRGTKASDRWCLSLSATEHTRQHSMNEEAFWLETGIDPHILALAIYGLWSELGDDATAKAEAVINARLAQVGRLRNREDGI